ncbi:MAG: hypothetical protein ACJ79R_04245 [Anaeromyxobacteraceae bacterium]
MLMFVGAKMLVVDLIQIPPAVSLAAVCAILGAGVAASAWRSRSGGPAIAARRAVEPS